MIIAEIGQNHLGDMQLAQNLIRLAKEAGADLVKFQLYDHNVLYANHPEIPNVELSYDQAELLFDYGRDLGIEVFFSVFDVERVKWCEEIGVNRYKIACTMRDIGVLSAVYNTGKEIIVSANFNYLIDISFGKVLACPPGYPQQAFCMPDFGGSISGFSDHTIGLDAAKIALAMGAQIIEKHFAINHYTGIDAPWSMTPNELRELKEWENKVKEVLCQKELVKS